MCDIKNNSYKCKKCGKVTTFSPSLKDRGMSKATAQCIFVDAKAGMCTDCFIDYRKK